MESQDEDSPVCPVCGANAQWEDEVTLPVKESEFRKEYDKKCDDDEIRRIEQHEKDEEDEIEQSEKGD